jgi:hypothetical protein
MTIEEAHRIVESWGRHLETWHAKLSAIFFISHIPQSFLPYSPRLVAEALGVLERLYADTGDDDKSQLMRQCQGPLAFYCNDEEAIEHLFQLINMPGFKAKEIMIQKLRELKTARATEV